MFDADFLNGADSAAVLEHLFSLAKAYTPEWRADPASPDPGVALAQLFSRMLTANITRVKRLREKISAQMVNMLDIRPLPASSARSVVQFSAVGADSVFLPRGVKLAAKSADGRTLTFETLHSLTVVSAEIGAIIFSSAKQGEIYYAGDSNALTLYGKARGLVPAASLTLEHPYLLRLEKNGSLRISFDGMPPENLEALADPDRFNWSFICETGDIRKAKVEKSGRENCLRLTTAKPEQTAQGARFTVRCKAVAPVTGEITASEIYIDSSAENVAPEQIWQDDIFQEDGRVYPFGKKLSLLSELRIACDGVLTQKGADITMRFNLEYEKFYYDLPIEQKRQYKLLMKAEAPVPPPVDVFAQEVSLECWNGTGWRPLKTNPAARRLFAGENAGEIRLSFTCPADVAPILLGAAERNWLRLRLLRADGCYLANAAHLTPVISDIRFSYKYRQKSQKPARVTVLREMRELDVTEKFKTGAQTGIFSPLSISGDRLMLGFGSKPAGDIINVYFDIERTGEPFWLEAEYSGETGFRKLHLDDYTDGLSHSDAIVFAAPQDFSTAEIYGESLYWIILRLRTRGEKPAPELKIRGVYLNAVAVEGKHTAEAEIFYTDELITKNELRLSSKGLLYAEVWIDEAASLSDFDKARLREKMPGSVTEEQDSSGNLLHFWVRWDEAGDFKSVGAKDRCYRLNRSSGTVTFPDGIRGRKPPTGESSAIRIIPVLSAGARGNVPEHTITQPLEQLDFIGGADNIFAACGGCDAQTSETLVKHACSYVRSGDRVVTAEDMLDAVQFSCGEIAKLRLICGDGLITLLFLPYDFENASRLFSQTEEHIREVLAQNWQDSPPRLRVLLPCFAEIIVEARVISSGDALNEEEAVRRRLDEFLHPITGGFGHTGWEIGALPQRDQILSVIQSACPKARVEMLRLSVLDRASGQYLSLRDVAGLRNVAVVPGKHNLIWRRKPETGLLNNS